MESRYNKVLVTMEITCYTCIRVNKQKNIKSWDQQNLLCYIRAIYNEVPLYTYLEYCTINDFRMNGRGPSGITFFQHFDFEVRWNTCHIVGWPQAVTLRSSMPTRRWNTYAQIEDFISRCRKYQSMGEGVLISQTLVTCQTISKPIRNSHNLGHLW